jgi:hypothetical protein
MKKIILILFLFLLVNFNYATVPHAPEQYFSNSGRFHITFLPNTEEAIILLDRKEANKYTFSIDHLRLRYDYPNMEMSTAGIHWYKNNIAVFNKNETFFIIKLGWDYYIFIDLRKKKIIKNPSKEILSEAKLRMKNMVPKMLDSTSPYKRETGAIACKDLKLNEYISKLKKLLNDKEFYTKYSGNDPGVIVLYVRKAAKEALIALGENVKNVVTELPEKGHLKYDKKLGRYIVIINKKNN